MTTQSKILIAMATVAVLLGAIVLVFAMGWPRIAAIDVEFLMTKYDPDGDPNDQPWRVYADLYHLTKGMVEQRNRHAMQFLCTLGFSLLAVGSILLAWSIDRERLSRRSGTGQVSGSNHPQGRRP